MRRIIRKRRTKIGMTMVELIVTMALTSLFAAGCVALIVPVEKIYMHMTDLSRAHLLADTCVDTLRKECAKTYIDDPGDAWVFYEENFDGTREKIVNAIPVEESGKLPQPNVLVIRKNNTYWETIASTPKYSLSEDLYLAVREAEENEKTPQTGSVTSRAVYRMFKSVEGGYEGDTDTHKGYIHFGYYEKTGSNYYDYYDFTNPFTSTAYRGFNVELYFDKPKFRTDGKPAYVNCTVVITKNEKPIYKRQTILCFASPVTH